MRETSGASDLISVCSSFSSAQTTQNLLIAIQRRGMILFARIDHAKAAAETLVKLRPMELFVFGYPETEAPLIAKNVAFGVDFPQRLLVWTDDNGGVWISYNDPIAIGRRIGADAETRSRLEAIRASLADIAAEVCGAKIESARA